MTQEDLAEKLNVSRGYLSLLESEGEKGEKLPSLQLLTKLCDVLIIRGQKYKSRSQLDQITRLSLAALDLPDVDLFEDLLGTLQDEIHLQQQRSIHELWIISDALAEKHSEALLETTVANLRDNVRYVYFVPHGDGELEWNEALARISTRLKPGSVPGRGLVAIASPKLMCVSRIRIVNPGMRDAQGTVSLGPLQDVVLHRLQQGQVERVQSELAPVLVALARAPEHTTGDGTTFRRLYPEEGWSNEP